jgi:hypothetical protein
MRWVRSPLLMMAMMTGVAVTPVRAHAQDYNQCWSTCHTGAMSIMGYHGMEAATGWFRGCINDMCESLGPI